MAKRCHLPKDTVYQAYLTDTLWGLLEQQGLFLRLKHHLDGIVPQGAELISQRVAASYKERHRSCQYTGCSDFTQNKHLQLNLRVEWFPNGEFAIFWGSCNPPIYFTANADQKILCAFKQIPDQTIFPVYQFLAKQPKETPGIWRVLNLSSPNEHGFRVYHKPYTAHLNDTKTLEQVVRWPIDTKVKIAKALLTSLAAMHKNKIVHYQLDLRAIHINAPKKGLEEAVIGNMEFARLMTDSTEIQNLPQHSEAPEFVAPELRLLHATQLQPSANVFSLGTIFKKLFGATYAAQSTEIFCEGMISRIIDRMTAENPQERCTAAEALNKFQNALETSPSR
ncbi:MAG: hypothetical protein KGQ49_02790 [Verrucomicrobia bacterium]|nr:hypothetical protein [Verrucomicrobiota bacterium]MBU6446308.1 hypothetical protein [Verrucomicrobiota bacterium]MDE3047731.1 protein kinase family protein [Verrucomicrobiota bacterium]